MSYPNLRERAPMPCSADTDQLAVASARQAALAGLYEYSLVNPADYAPYTGSSPRTVTTTAADEFEFYTQEDLQPPYKPRSAPPGTVLKLYDSVTCWRVGGFTTPDGECWHLTAT